MATIVEDRPGTRVVEDRTVYSGSEDSSGWAIALIVLVVLALIALFAWTGIANRAAPATPGSIQVNLPSSGNSSSGGAASTPAAAPAGDSGAGAQGAVDGSATQ